MISIAILVSILLSISAFARGFFILGQDINVWVVFVGVIWLIAAWRRWLWFPEVALFAAVGLAVWGISLSADLLWMMSGAAGALLYWDLSNLRMQKKFLPAREDVRGMERRHLLRLTAITLFIFLLVTGFVALFGGIDPVWFRVLEALGFLIVLQGLMWLFRKR